MLRMQKITTVLLAVSLSRIACAGMYEATTVETGCGADSVTVGCPRLGWGFGLEGMYIRTNDLEQATVIFDDPSPGVQTFQKLVPKWAVGYRGQVSYHWSTANDISLNWTHFSKETNQTLSDITDDIGGYFVGAPFDSISTTLNDNANVINVEVGQGVSYGDHVLARYHGGAQFARVTQDVTQNGSDSFTSIIGSATSNSQYSGAGPRAGIDLAYSFGNGFSVVCTAAGSILYGKRTFDFAFSNSDIHEPISISSDSAENIIVPGADAKAGVKFTYPMSIGDFSLEGGYRIANYWQAVEQSFPNNGAVVTFGDQNNNFGYQGVYLGLYWLENS